MPDRGGFSDFEDACEDALGADDSNDLVHSGVIVSVSRVPLHADDGRPFLMMLGAWISLYAIDASRPAYLYMIAGPPGCSGAKPVMSQTTPSTTIQQSSSLLCEEISCTEIFLSPIFSSSVSVLWRTIYVGAAKAYQRDC